jgi:hypothetical protein
MRTIQILLLAVLLLAVNGFMRGGNYNPQGRVNFVNTRGLDDTELPSEVVAPQPWTKESSQIVMLAGVVAAALVASQFVAQGKKRTVIQDSLV